MYGYETIADRGSGISTIPSDALASLSLHVPRPPLNLRSQRPLHVAMLSFHTSPLARPGGRGAGGMNVYVRQLSNELGRLGHQVDIFTRRTDRATRQVQQVAPGVRLITLAAGP